MTFLSVLALAFYCGVCALACFLIVPLLKRYRIQDIANERSSHTGTTPRGGGIAFAPILLLGWGITNFLLDAELFWWIALFMTVGVAGISLLDDVFQLTAASRLAVHLVLVSGFCFLLPIELLVELPPLPELIIRTLMVIGLIWWLNLYNFMDGIDGLTVIETGSIAVGIVALALWNDISDSSVLIFIALLVLLTAASFSWVNWFPARVFMGDVGSITLGSATGVLLIYAQKYVPLPILLILPMYYLVDATSTLIWRIFKREKFWQAHRQHAYQAYVGRGYSHSNACLIVAALNVVLLGIALADPFHPWLRFFIAFLLTVATVAMFRMRGQGREARS